MLLGRNGACGLEMIGVGLLFPCNGNKVFAYFQKLKEIIGVELNVK